MRNHSVVRISLCCLLVAGWAAFTAAAEEALPAVKVFTYLTEGYNAYRIPSLICTPKGTLLAFCEGRKVSPGEDQSPINLVLKRSLDNGKTWEPMQVVAKGIPECATNPTAVFDRDANTILLVYSLWPQWPKERRHGEFQGKFQRAPGLGRDSITIWVTTSSDEGATWSPPRNITAMAKKPAWSEIICGPGVGIQTRSGRLVIPCIALTPDKSPRQNPWPDSQAYVIYSDDHGKTWQISDKGTGPGISELQIVELADGALL